LACIDHTATAGRMSNYAVYATSAIPGPDDIIRVKLPNGIVVLTRSNFSSPSVTIGGRMSVGSLFDPPEKLGLANFTAMSLMRGTQEHSFHQIYETLESVGAALSFTAGTHTTTFSGRCLVEDLDMLLSILSETLRRPSFPQNPIEKLRTQLLTGLSLRQQSTEDQAAMEFDKLVYPGHPYEHPDEGYIYTVQALTLEEMQQFHTRNYGPQNMSLTIVGGIGPEVTVAKVQAALGDWSNPQQPEQPELPPWQPLAETKRKRIQIPDKSQSDLVIGTAGPPRDVPEYLAASLGNSVLGQFGMMGRIGSAVREKAGMAYYAFSSLGSSLGPGPWAVQAGVDPKNEGQVVSLILKELRRFVSKKVTEDELSDSKSNFIGSLPLSLETNIGVAMALLHLEKHHLGLDYYQRYPEMVNAVTRQDVLETARKYLDPDKLAISIAGP
jgi:zinc protease